jgi:V/A-type H+-transporting ATPase subunit D
MTYFVRPSKAELINTKQEISLIQEFMELIDERVKLLTKEKLRLEKIINQKKKNLVKFKIEFQDMSNKVLKKYGLINLKRISEFTRKSLKINLKYEYIAGVKYYFPAIIKSKKIPYPLSITSFEVDELASATEKFMENIIDISKYIEAFKKINYELNLIKRKLNALKNIILPELNQKQKKIKKYLNEKDRFEKVFKMKLIKEIKKDI